MTTTAVRDGDHYVVNGSKTFITNGINADLVITAVKTDPTQRHKGISLLVVERGMARASSAAATSRRSAARPGHRRAVLHRRARAGRQPARRGGQGFIGTCDNLPQERLSIARPASPRREAGARPGR
jgi:alkylation response protein AidB-like acyl-CoA dehydrogenase